MTSAAASSKRQPVPAGRRDDPLYRVRNILRAGQEHLSDRQQARLRTAFTAREEHVEVEAAYRCAQQARACFHQDTHAAGRRLAETVLTSLPTRPIPELARLGRTLKQWWEAFLGYFDTNRASNGGTEAVNGLISSTGRARGFRNREVKDFWQHRTRFVANTRWWPPFCATTDWVAAAILAAAIAIGADLG